MAKLIRRVVSMFKQTATCTALSLLEDESSARAYVYARADAADRLQSELSWTVASGFLRCAEYKGVLLFKDLSGIMIGTIGNEVWGVVQIGGHSFRVESEAQAIAYLLARFHAFEEHGFLLSPRSTLKETI